MICMCFFSFGLSAETLAQSEKVRLNVKDATLETVFNEIQRQTNLAFLFNHELVADLGTLSLNVNNVSVEEVLNDLFEGTGLTWSLTATIGLQGAPICMDIAMTTCLGAALSGAISLWRASSFRSWGCTPP